MLTGSQVNGPDVAGDGGGVVLAPLIFAALAVLIVEGLAVGTEADHLCRCGEYLLGTAPVGRYLVEFGHRTRGEEGAAGGVLNGC